MEIDPTKFVWNSSSVKNKNRGLEIEFDAAKIVESFNRPFCKQNFYLDELLNERLGKMRELFPNGAENLLICVSGIGNSKDFSVLITNRITDYQMNFNTQCYPLYYYERSGQGSLFGENLERRDGISDYILNEARKRFGDVSFYICEVIGRNLVRS